MQIVINKTYFDNIKVAIDAMNNFFASGFKTKSFPVVNNDFELDRILSRTMSWLNNVEPSWIENPENAIHAIETLKKDVVSSAMTPTQPDVSTQAIAATDTESGDIAKEAVEETQPDPTNPWINIISGENKAASDIFHAFVGFKVLQYITNNFDKYEQLMNGIYSFELFTKPSMYREAITTFTTAIPMPELDEIAKLPGEYKLFDASDYVNSIFDNDQIKLPESMQPDTEIQRFRAFIDLQDCQIVINDAVQEAAKIDYFETFKPEHITYDPKSKKFKVSKQFEKAVDKLLGELRKCNTTEDLAALFSGKSVKPDIFAENVIPYVLYRVFTSEKKYPAGASDMGQYQKSYDSIAKQNVGARRFERIDLFSTFKTDKEGTIQFLEDFLKLNLVNNDNVVISNNTLLTVFNIFDSHIYLSIMYRMMNDEKESMDGYIKRIRARINQNSHSANPYQKRKTVKNTIEGSDQVVESVMETIKELGDLSIADMQYCESFAGAVYDDIDTIGDAFYNKGVSPIMIDRYIGESYDVIGAIVQEAVENGEIPSYIQSRIGLSDTPGAKKEDGKTKKKRTVVKDEDDEDEDLPVPDYMRNRMDTAGDIDPSITDIQLPPDVPMNKPEDLANSIDARLDVNANSLGDMLGADYKGKINSPNHGGPGSVIYNITNNYSNSHNTTTHNDLSQKTNTTHNDLSQKTNTSNVTTTNNDLSTDKRTNSGAKTKPLNNYDNTRPSSNSKESDTFSNGKSVQEVFTLLNSEEPLFVESVSGNPPKGDMLTTAMDVDKATLPGQQKLKRGVQYVKNTGEAIKKPIRRTKDWLRTTVDSFIKRDEERVKNDLVENPSYRSALYKIARIAIKTGKFALFYAISPWLGFLVLGIEVAKIVDKDRLRKEAEGEIATEIQIIDEKIERLKSGGRWGEKQSEEDRQELYKYMRMRQKLVNMSTNAHKQRFANPKSVY